MDIKNVSGKKIIRILFLKCFTSEILIAIINIILPIIISINCTNFTDNIKWWSKTIGIFIIILSFNIISVIAKNKQNKQNKYLNTIYKCYNDQTIINEKAATNIYRLNKTILGYILEGKPVNSKKIFDKIADFQTLSFIICESIYNMIVSEFGINLKCQVTLMKNKSGDIKMLAYANENKKMPSSYTNTFTSKDIDIFFVKLFQDLNGNISCLPNKESISKNFRKLVGSEKREEEICQYIGIPIKTNRNQIELLLQIDISKEKVFGKDEEDMLKFSKNILYPYAVLLHKSYERDLIFNQYYDLIIKTLSKDSKSRFSTPELKCSIK